MAAEVTRTLLNDPVHGLIPLDALQEDLIALPELTRLAWVKQLGLTFLSFPGAMHSRLSHAIGASHIATKMAQALRLQDTETRMLKVAALLHSVGHTPFSHALEGLLPCDHLERARALVLGEARMDIPGAGRIPRVLERNLLDPVRVADLVGRRSKNDLLQRLLFGAVDCDQLDYLLRDSYFCGISHGQIDLYRIMYTLKFDLVACELVLEEKGTAAIENMLVAREQMYNAVYGHKTGRIGEMMLLRAVQFTGRPPAEFQDLTDHELLARLQAAPGLPARLTQRVVYRQLFKAAYRAASDGREDVTSRAGALLARQSVRELEVELAREAGLEPGDVIVDVPDSTVKLSEPRLRRFPLRVQRKSGEYVPLVEVSTLIRSLTEKDPVHTVFAAYCDARHRDRVAAVCRARLE